MSDWKQDQLNRLAKIQDWIEWGEQRVSDLISRPSETASLSGFDPEPRQVPCSHPALWRRGRLCLLCDNIGWRDTVYDELGIDPYSVDVTQVKGGFTAQSAGDESEAQKRSARMRLLDHQLERIQQDVDLREGRIGQLDAMMANVDRLAHSPSSFVKVRKALALMRDNRPDLYEQLPSPFALLWLSHHVPGRIDPVVN